MNQALDLERGLFEPAPQPFGAELIVQRTNTLMAKALAVDARSS